MKQKALSIILEGLSMKQVTQIFFGGETPTCEKHKEKNIPYSLRRGISLSVPNFNTQKYGRNSLTFRESVLWNSLSIKFKKCKFLQEFYFNKLLLKQCENLPCTFSAFKS